MTKYGLVLLTCLWSVGIMAETVSIQTQSGSVDLNVDIADTVAKARRGLMFRPSIPDDYGMMFIYPDDQVWSMWMKNTFIPLEMIFFDRAGIITQIEHAKPLDLTSIQSNQPVAGVLEVNAGVSHKKGILVGDIITPLPKFDSTRIQ